MIDMMLGAQIALGKTGLPVGGNVARDACSTTPSIYLNSYRPFKTSIIQNHSASRWTVDAGNYGTYIWISGIASSIFPSTIRPPGFRSVYPNPTELKS